MKKWKCLSNETKKFVCKRTFIKQKYIVNEWKWSTYLRMNGYSFTKHGKVVRISTKFKFLSFFVRTVCRINKRWSKIGSRSDTHLQNRGENIECSFLLFKTNVESSVWSKISNSMINITYRLYQNVDCSCSAQSDIQNHDEHLTNFS